MNGYKIDITDILGSIKININTPIIILSNVPKKYLIQSENNQLVYNIDVDNLHNDLESLHKYIDRFIPVGQIYVYGSNKKFFTILMANTRIVPSTRNFEQIKKNIWVGIIRKNDKVNRSIGTIYSETKPDIMIPVFPDKFLKKIDYMNDDLNQKENNIYANIYSDKIYGKWIIDNYKFNMNKSYLKMIDSSGEISNMFVPPTIAGMQPSTSETDSNIMTNAQSVTDSESKHIGDKRLNRKVYFSAQGAITNDANCRTQDRNLEQISINDCNESGANQQETNNISAMTDDTLEMNDVSVYSDVFSPLKKSKLAKSGKSLILKEKDEPWFTDSMIVGSAASIADPHKITGHISTIVDGTLYDGTVYTDDLNYEINAPYTSDCVIDNVIGYSRSDADKKCRGDEKTNSIENFNEPETNTEYVNNIIMYVMCIILIILIMYRMIDKK
jgi:hypothetical protein